MRRVCNGFGSDLAGRAVRTEIDRAGFDNVAIIGDNNGQGQQKFFATKNARILMSEIINVAYCFDKLYQQHAAACAMSVASNFKSKTKKLVFHFVSDQLTPEMKAFGADFEDVFGCAVIHYDVSEHKDKIQVQFPPGLFEGKYWTIATLFRLLLPSILPDSIKTLLYLDCDTIVLDDVSKLFEFDIQNNIAAAVVDPQDAIEDISLRSPDCFNAGVMIIRLDRWREEQIAKQCFTFLATPGVSAPFWDQDAINHILKGRILALPQRWNRQIVNRSVSERAIADVHQRASILHFVSSNKPWQAWYYHPVGQFYWAYLHASPWRNPVKQAPVTAFEHHKMAKSLVQRGQFRDASVHYEKIAQHFIGKMDANKRS